MQTAKDPLPSIGYIACHTGQRALGGVGAYTNFELCLFHRHCNQVASEVAGVSVGEQLGDLADALFHIKIWTQGGKMINIWEGFASTQGWKDQFVEGRHEMVSLSF